MSLQFAQNALANAVDASAASAKTRSAIAEDDQLRFYRNIHIRALTSSPSTEARFDETLTAPFLNFPKGWDVCVESLSLDTSYYSGSQVKLWRRIVITSGSLPIIGDIDGNVKQQVITDFMLDNDGVSAADITRITYTPFIRRFYQLSGSTPLSRMELQIFYAEEDNVLQPFELSYNSSTGFRGAAFVKLGFRKRVAGLPF